MTTNLSNHKQSSPFYDDLVPLQPNSADDDSTSDLNPSDLDEHEQQDAALQAEWHAHATAIQALNQLGSDSDALSATGSDEELGNTPANLSHIENIKFTQEFIEEISTATFKNGYLDDDVIHRL
jgi:hypothetical protein